MDSAQIVKAIDQWLVDSRSYIIVGLIAIQFVLAVGAALRANVFEWKRLGDFYRSQVVPKLMGYLVLYVVLGSVNGVSEYVGNGLQWAAFAPLAVSLVASIAANFMAIFGVALPMKPDNPA
jgi:hypothetical protein